MKCLKPYVRSPVGASKKEWLLCSGAKDACTPFACGRCIPCRITKGRMWAARIMLEYYHAQVGCFVTLTYDDANYPQYGNLSPEDFKNFIKRLRYYTDQKLRYFGVGEYGDQTWRPHYHLAIFGLDYQENEKIEKAWGKGFTAVGEINQTTANYISGYCVKGMTWKNHPKLEGRHPEFMRCSKMEGGIGIGAIRQAAERLSRNENLKFSAVKFFEMGKKKLLLGRYLTKKLAECTGKEEELKNDFYNYQKEVFELCSGNEDYYSSILEIDRVKNLATVNNHRKRKRRSL